MWFSDACIPFSLATNCSFNRWQPITEVRSTSTALNNLSNRFLIVESKRKKTIPKTCSVSAVITIVRRHWRHYDQDHYQSIHWINILRTQSIENRLCDEALKLFERMFYARVNIYCGKTVSNSEKRSREANYAKTIQITIDPAVMIRSRQIDHFPILTATMAAAVVKVFLLFPLTITF